MGEVTIYEGQEQVEQEIAPVVEQANDIVVTDQNTRDAAMTFLKEVKKAQKRVQEFWGPLKTSAHDAWKRVVAAEKSMLDPLNQSEQVVKKVIVVFDREEEAKRLAEQKRLQAEAEAKAEAERQRLLKQAQKLKTPELKEQRVAEAQSVVAPTVSVAPSVEKTQGEATVKRWKARLVSMQELVASAAAGNGLAFTLLEFNQVAANKQAVATKNNVPVPGVEFYAEESLSVRTK